MAFPEEIPQPVVPTKRRLDDDDDCELAELKKPKTVVQKYPPPKIRLGVQVSRDFPPGCGIIHESLEVERKPMKKLDNVDANFKDKLANSNHFESKKLNYSFKPKGLGLKKSYFGTKSSNKVKFWDPMQHVVDDIPPVYGIIGERNSKFVERNTFELRKRKMNCDALIVYDTYYTQLSQENGSKQKAEKIPPSRVPAMAAKITIQKLKWMSPEKSLGEISGIQIGDKFKFRSQLQMVGLHSQPNCGIDYIDINGKNLAISIVDSRRYSKEIGQSCDVLSYCGEGGGRVQFGFSKGHVANDDQKLVRGNLALKNSMKEKSPIRVIRKVVGVGKKNYFFVYDGLYIVKDCRQRRSLGDRMVFMFKLHKIPGQCHVQKMVNAIPGDVALYQCSTFQMLI